MPEEKWYQNPEKASQAAAVIILALAALLTWLFADEEVKKMFALAVSGDVEALAAYFRSFGAWAMLISFLLDVLINAGSIFPSIFISTANGLIFGLPLGILISWLAETTGVVISFWLTRYLFRGAAEKMIAMLMAKKEKFLAMCQNSLLPGSLQERLASLIEERAGILEGGRKNASVFSVRNFDGNWRGKQNFHARLHYCQPYRQVSFNGAGGCYRARHC